MPEIPVRVAYEQEECIKEEISDVSLPEMYSTEESVHTGELKLETPKINAVEINEVPREIKLEMPIEQSESKLMQDMTLVSDVPTQFHNHADFMTKQEISMPNRTTTQPVTEQENSVSNGTIQGKLIPKIHTRQRNILGSKLVRRVIHTRLVRRIIPPDTKSIGRPPFKLPDKQNGSENEINKKMSPYKNPIYRPLPSLLI